MNITAKFENGYLTIQIPETWLSELKNANWLDSHYVGEINDLNKAGKYLAREVVNKSIEIGNGAEASPIELMLIDMLEIATQDDEKFVDQPEDEVDQEFDETDNEIYGDDQEIDGSV